MMALGFIFDTIFCYLFGRPSTVVRGLTSNIFFPFFVLYIDFKLSKFRGQMGKIIFFLFFVLYVDLKLSDDIFEERKKKLSPNGENWSMEKFEKFCLLKWIFGVFAVFSTVFAVFRP
jgi:hypothetical protein